MGLQRHLRFPEDPDSQSSLGIDSLITPALRQIGSLLGPGLPEGFGHVGASYPVNQPRPCMDGGGSISASSSWLMAIEKKGSHHPG